MPPTECWLMLSGTEAPRGLPLHVPFPLTTTGPITLFREGRQRPLPTQWDADRQWLWWQHDLGPTTNTLTYRAVIGGPHRRSADRMRITSTADDVWRVRQQERPVAEIAAPPEGVFRLTLMDAKHTPIANLRLHPGSIDGQLRPVRWSLRHHRSGPPRLQDGAIFASVGLEYDLLDAQDRPCWRELHQLDFFAVGAKESLVDWQTIWEAHAAPLEIEARREPTLLVAPAWDDGSAVTLPMGPLHVNVDRWGVGSCLQRHRQQLVVLSQSTIDTDLTRWRLLAAGELEAYPAASPRRLALGERAVWNFRIRSAVGDQLTMESCWRSWTNQPHAQWSQAVQTISLDDWPK